ncbi:MAG TPA: hypothetical protein VFU68_08175 [Terracidiphilus sp.]|nr:hypothetical protein [Terracidiphilus sp.]
MTLTPLHNLLVTQHGLRHPHPVLRQMVRYVARGGFWTVDRLAQHLTAFSPPRPSSLIELVRVEDGNCYVHNGHHRCAATWLGGRTYLRSDEYQLHERTYSWYMEANPECGYFLTFDPRLHVRNADFLSLQREAQRRFQVDRVAGERWRRMNVDSYRRRRVLQTVPEFAQSVSRHAFDAFPEGKAPISSARPKCMAAL